MPLEFLISALITLLVVVDPIGLVPSYLAITHGLPQRARRSVALHATLIAAAILVGSALVGDWLLRTLSIGLPAFRIAGGLLLFSIASWCSACELGVNHSKPNRPSKSTSATSRPSRSPFP
jgi:multiple antibiotic resistance protein